MIDTELKIHVLIPMSGQGTRYKEAGYEQPKPLIPVNEVPMLQRLLSNFNPHWDYSFVLAENHRDSGLESFVRALIPHAQIYYIPAHNQGPSYAAIEALKHIPSNQPILLSYCDYGMIWDHTQFESFVRRSECDSCLISYRGFHPHYLFPTNYAFSRIKDGLVKEVREKGNFTGNRENEFASAGAYYFKSSKILTQAIEFQTRNALKLNGEFFTSLTVEALLQANPSARVKVFEIPYFFQWGTPQDLKIFEYWERTFTAYLKLEGVPLRANEACLMPMAGFGNRYRGLTSKSKPLIKIGSTEMFRLARNSLPPSRCTVFVSLSELENHITLDKQNNEIFEGLPATPPGQALTTLYGLQKLGDKNDIFVSACDHSVFINPEKWNQFLDLPDCDAAIFTIKGFPGTIRTPLSYSYVEVDDNTEFPLLSQVSVKKPITTCPDREHLLVGSFWFRSATQTISMIEELIATGEKTNNEVYLDAVFKVFQKNNFKVRIFELDGYINWGDPDSLKEALYWNEVFLGCQLTKRETYPGMKFNEVASAKI